MLVKWCLVAYEMSLAMMDIDFLLKFAKAYTLMPVHSILKKQILLSFILNAVQMCNYNKIQNKYNKPISMVGLTTIKNWSYLSSTSRPYPHENYLLIGQKEYSPIY